MKYLNALLQGEENSSHPRRDEPLKPLKSVSAVSAGAHLKGRGETGEPSSSKPAAIPNYRSLYQRMTQAIPPNSPTVDAWLAERHPSLWRKIRELDDELTRLEQEGAEETVCRAKLEELLSLCRAAKSLRERHWGALLIRSEVLGGELVWVVQNEEEARAVMGDGRAIYFADEIELLKSKAPAEIRDIHKAKLAFPGSRVVQ